MIIFDLRVLEGKENSLILLWIFVGIVIFVIFVVVWCIVCCII